MQESASKISFSSSQDREYESTVLRLLSEFHREFEGGLSVQGICKVDIPHVEKQNIFFLT